MVSSSKQIYLLLLITVLVIVELKVSFGHVGVQHSGSCASPVHQSPPPPAHHHCDHGHDHHHQRDYQMVGDKKLPEELAEEEDLKLYGYGSHHHDHDHDHHDSASELSGLGNFV